MNSKLVIIVEISAKPAQADGLRAGLLAMLEPSRAEAGCVSYTLHESPEKPGSFVFYEIWKDDAAFDFHTHTAHFKQLGPAIASLIDGDVKLRKLRIVG